MLSFLRVATMVALIGTFSTPILAVDKPVISGYIGRKDTAAGSFSFTIKVTNVENIALKPKEKELLKDRLRFWLPVGSGNEDYVRYEGETQPSTVPFYWTGTLDQKEIGNNKQEFTWSIKVYETDPNTASLAKMLKDGGGKSIKLKIQYLEDLAMISEEQTATLSYTSAIVKSAPTGMSTSGTHRAIVANWTPESTVTWSDTTVTSAPTIISILAIDKTTLRVNLPAYIYDSSKDTDAEAGEDVCQYNPNFVDGSACITCSNANAYLDASKLETLTGEGIFTKFVSASLDKASVPGLENGKNYAVVAFYQPGGLERSVCLTATPEANVTWSEQNGEDEAKLMDPKCFIATAAYGSKLHKNLKPLRWFRDNVLLRSKVGRNFVDWYYEHGPKAASVVAAYPALQTIVQGLLWLPVIAISSWMMLVVNYPQASSPLVVAGIVALFAIGFLLRKRSRKV